MAFHFCLGATPWIVLFFLSNQNQRIAQTISKAYKTSPNEKRTFPKLIRKLLEIKT